MEEMELPPGVKVVETGIGGMSLVQELQEGYDALIVADAVDLGRPPGHVMLILPEVIDVNELEFDVRMDLLADMHLTTPDRALMLSKALGVLPPNLLMVGCQPVDAETPRQGMSEEVTKAVDVAIREIVEHLEKMLPDAAGEDPEPSATDEEPSEPRPHRDFLGIGNLVRDEPEVKA
jgi:hydrogenase maturation protease